MLYDPKWNETKADPFTLESLIAWLEKQPAAGRYNYWNCAGNCLLDQYLGATGFDRTSLANYHKAADIGGYNVGTRVAQTRPWTFGAALQRARALSA